jgi:hypothetical protein
MSFSMSTTFRVGPFELDKFAHDFSRRDIYLGDDSVSACEERPVFGVTRDFDF